MPKDKLPVPVLVTITVWPGGETPALLEKLSAVGLTVNAV